MYNIYDSEDFFAAYAKMDRSVGGLEAAGEWHQLAPLMGELHGKSVLDLGCGYGWHCKYAAENGAAEVLGIDISERMIATARERNADARVRYEVGAIDGYDYPEARYDLVLSNLALHYIADLEGVYRNVWRTLRDRGSFLFNIEHPVFTAGVNEDWVYDADGRVLYWPVDRYFYPGERSTNFLGHPVKKQHHTLTQILAPLIRLGFVIEAVEEVMPDVTLREILPDEMRRPMMLLVRARKS